MTARLSHLALAGLLLATAGCRARQVRPFDLPADAHSADLVKEGALNGGLTRSDSPGDSVASGHYQYPYLGLGGVALLLSPDGATSDLVETSAPTPGIFLEGLWSAGSRVKCFSVTSRVLGPGEPREQRALRFRQRLSLRQGVAYTAYEEKIEGRTVASRVTTFVTPDGVVVLRFEDDAGEVGPNWARQVVVHGEGEWMQRREMEGASLLRAQQGAAAAWGAVRSTPEPIFEPMPCEDFADRSLPLRVGQQPVVAYVAFGSGPDGDADATRKVEEAQALGYDACLKATRQWWSDFWDASSVKLPDPDLQRWYERSMFQLGCAFGGASIPIGPMGLVPARWGGHVFAHDLTYMHYALVTGSRADVALPLIRWYADVLPTAQRHAREAYQLPGARYGWEQDRDGREVVGRPYSEEHHVNGEVAFQAYTQALWTGDEEAMRLARQILPPATQFLCAHMERDPATGLYLSPESTDLDEYAELIRGGISTQTATIWCLRAAGELGCLPEDLREHVDRIYLPKAKWEGKDVLVVYQGDDPERDIKHPAPLVGVWWWPVLDPGGDLARHTHDNVRSRLSLEKTPTFNPAWLACISARMAQGDAALESLQELLTAKGALVDDTCFAEAPGNRWTPFFTTYGALASAVHEMLLQSWDADRVDVFPALPSAWEGENVSFEGLLARGGITVSAGYSPKQITARLLSPTAATRTVTLPTPAEVAKPRLFVDGREHSFDLDNGRVVTTLSLPAGDAIALELRGP